MAELESRAAACGFQEAWPDLATNQPEAMAFYESLGYTEVDRESRPEWHWTLVHYVKAIPH